MFLIGILFGVVGLGTLIVGIRRGDHELADLGCLMWMVCWFVLLLVWVVGAVKVAV